MSAAGPRSVATRLDMPNNSVKAGASGIDHLLPVIQRGPLSGSCLVGEPHEQPHHEAAWTLFSAAGGSDETPRNVSELLSRD